MNAHVKPRDAASDFNLICQNPLYPQDAGLTEDEFNAMARERSMARAQSPGELICQIDGTSSLDDPTHADDFQTCMDFRHEHVIGDDDPWTYWELYDVWAEAQPPLIPPPPAPPPQVGWQPVARVNPGGISQMDNFGTASNVTFAVRIEPAMFTMPAGSQVRVRLSGHFNFDTVYIGPGGGLDGNGNPNNWISPYSYLLKFNGQTAGSIPPGMSDGNSMDPFGELISDPLPQSLDFTQGVIVSFFALTTGSQQVTRRMVEPGWSCKNNTGNFSSTLDKSNWSGAGGNSIGLLMIESFYP